jgi:hypothetical protein
VGDLFADAVAQIEAAYVRLGHRLGWRFLATPRRTLNRRARIAFITTNPGGRGVDPDHGEASCEAGSAYLHESWKGRPPGNERLQQQVRAMFEWLGCDPNKTLSAYFIPFRSASLPELVARRESYSFAVQLWRGLFHHIRPTLVVCIGNDAEKGLHSVFGRPIATTAFPVGWAPQTAVLSQYAGHLILRLPHLSHFGIFGRAASAEPLGNIRAEVHRYYSALPA